MTIEDGEKPADATVVDAPSKRGPGGKQPGAGRKPTHGAAIMRRTLRTLTTKRLDQRTSVAIAVKAWKADIRRDLGGDLTRAQEAILELAAQSWLVVSALDDWIACQPSLVTKKRQVVPVVLQRMTIAEGLARNLERLGLDRRSKMVDLAGALAQLHEQPAAGEPATPLPAPITTTHTQDGTTGTLSGNSGNSGNTS